MDQETTYPSEEVRDLQFLIDEGLEMLAVFKSISDSTTRKQAMRILRDMAAAQNGKSH